MRPTDDDDDDEQAVPHYDSIKGSSAEVERVIMKGQKASLRIKSSFAPSHSLLWSAAAGETRPQIRNVTEFVSFLLDQVKFKKATSC